ncbi:DUF1127 domain-containing protein [Vibrio sp. JC009]|uniref:DUF1127 domain-containing protein n=1 Tax=Vibrio sp. JC009 TaxID=2912314 RepID=UPI0023B0869F|nr:DUF1127 domain-containing protein [Vibrio sp. JC009]WED22380.1 DUF1127 domain-containing protein [Vibrio sp. JC009]
MTHSVYIKLAAVLIKADLRREEREWKRKVRRSVHEIPWENAYLLRDIGLEADGRPIGTHSVPDAVLVERRIRHIRRVLHSRIAT